MKTFTMLLVASSLVAGAAVPAFAGDSDAPTYKDQMTNLWISTGDPTYARLAGISPRQLQEGAHMSAEHQDLD